MKNAPIKTMLQGLLHLIMAFILIVGIFEIQPVDIVNAAGSTIYVRAGATRANNGTSWMDAYTDLQSALLAAASDDQIWVAAGTYYPTTGTNPAATFTLENGVSIYGGFAGTETQLSQRNPKVNITTLSGEIGSPTTKTDNIFHVVTGSGTDATAVLDGFTITAGNADGDAPLGGGGMLIQNGSPTLSNLIFGGNKATYGGGMFNYPNSSPTLYNVNFSGNSAERGGGMYNNSNSNPTLTNVTFTGNTAILRGGGMSVSNSTPTLINVTFSGNVSSLYGGALHTVFSGSPILRNVTISGNTAPNGGGIFDEGGDPVISNSIIYNNSTDQISVLSGAPIVTNSIVQGGYTGTNVLDQDPFLGPLQDNGGYTKTMALGSGSAAIDQLDPDVDPANCPPHDQRGVIRPQGTLCDMGAYELDNTGPTVTNISSSDADGLYIPGMMITITVSFSEIVNVTGTPQLTLETGAVDRNASYLDGSGTNTLNFSYTVQSNDSSSDLDYVSPTALTLNGGTLKDIANNNAVLTLPNPGEAGSLGANRNFVVDGVIPALTSFTRQSPTAELTNSDSLVLRASFNEEVTNVDASDFLVAGTTTATITDFSPVDVSTYDLTVSGGDLAGFNGTVGLDLNSSTDIKDPSGNLLSPGEPSTDDIYTVDNITPSVNTITRVDSDPSTASSVAFAVTFTESVSDVDPLDFVLTTTGDFSGAAITGISGSGSGYTVNVNTWFGIGTIRLDVVDDDTIKDQAGNPLGGSGTGNGNFASGQTYTINKTATNQVTIGGTLMGSYSIPSTKTMVTSYATVQNGPVKVTSTNASTFFTSQRVISGTSFNEVMGYPTNQLTTEYWFPWYDNIDMATWVLVGNASSTQAAAVDIYIGGAKKGSYTIPVGGQVRPRFPLKTGPVRVVSTNGVKIFTSERTMYGSNSAFNEVMGYPANQFTTEYWFPWYDNKDMSTWILVGNPSTTSTAAVDIYIGGAKKGSYAIPKGGQITPRFGTTQAGPVRVVSTNGVNIFSSERTVYGDSFNEVMGYPKNQFTTEYWYPWYDNVGMMTWVLVGNPTGSTAAVDIYIGTTKYSYTIAAGKQINQRFPLNTGPVRVVSTNGVKIFSSERVLYGTSFNEVMGYAGNKLTTEYWFPWYDSTTMSSNILVGKP